MRLLRQLLRGPCSRQIIACILTYLMLFNIILPVAKAGPEGAQVVNGDVSIAQSGYDTSITASDKAIINYSSFDIAQPETVQFIQPGSSASVLNRILSANPTNINGTVLANGRVFFVNPAGVYFGEGARVNVNQLVASALNMSDSDFLNGRYNFAGGNGSVLNSGSISAEQVHLIGKQVTNSGTISCPAGYVVMAAGDRVFLGEPGSEIVLEVDGASLPQPGEVAGPETGVLNEGTVEAAGGIIALAAAGDIYSQGISNVGSVSVSTEAGRAGDIELAAAGGQVINTGTIEASGAEGGQIVMEGARVGQFGTVHADGTTGNGGNVNLTASDVVALSSESLTTANAGLNGNGGEVIAYSPATALFRPDAKIEARGGSESGDGGFIEVSGKERVEVYGSVDTLAPGGNAGSFLIDPYNVTISNADVDGTWTGPPYTFTPTATGSTINVATLQTNLSSANVVVTTNTGTGPEDGDITVAAAIDYSAPANNNLTLQADNDIFVNSTITAGDNNLTLQATGNVDISSPISMTSGSFTSGGVDFTSSGGGTITTTGGNVDIQNTGNITIGANISVGAGTVSIDGGDGSGGSTAAGIVSNGGTITSSGTITFEASGSIGTAGMAIDTAGIGAISATSTGGDIYIDNADNVTDLRLRADLGMIDFANTGSVDTGAAITANAISLTSSGAMTIDQAVTADRGAVTLSGASLDIDAQIRATASIDLTANLLAGADIDLANIDNIIDAGSGDVTLNASGNIVVANDANIEINTSGSVSLTAQAIGQALSPTRRLRLSGPSELSITHAGPGTVDIGIANGDSIDIEAGYVLNNIDLDQGAFDFFYTAETGDILIGNVDMGTADAAITASYGAIDSSAPDTDITADTLTLEARRGIGATRALELEVGSLSAATYDGNIDLDNMSPSAVQLTSVAVTDAAGDITFDQTGGGDLTLASVTTAEGTIDISAASGNITATLITAGDTGDILLDTTTSGDISVGSLVAGGSITVDSAGAIEETVPDAGADLTAGTLDLHAVTGIGAADSLELETVSLSAAATGAGANIALDQNGGGPLTLTSVTTADGTIDISVDSANMTATLVTAGGAGDILLDTTTSGDIAVGSLTAADDNITINSAGAINEAAPDAGADLTAGTLDLHAVTGIGAADSLEIEAASLSAATTDAGANIALDGIGSGPLALTSVTTADGTIDVSADSGNIAATLVAAGGTGDILLDTTTSGDISVGSLAAGGSITVDSAGAIEETVPDAGADLAAGALDLHAVTGIGAADSLEIVTADLTAATTGARADITIDHIGSGDLTLTSVTTVDGTVDISTDTAGMTATLVTADGAGDIVLDAISGDITLGSLTAGNNIAMQAPSGAITQGAGAIDARGGSLSMTSQAGLNTANYNVTDPGDTNLILSSTGEAVTSTTADDWRSVTATALSGITLEGLGNISAGQLQSANGNIEVRSTAGDLQINGGVTAERGGVSLIADAGKIQISSGPQNIPITGYSDIHGSGVGLLKAGDGRGAIVMISREDLTLGPNATLTAKGSYDPIAVGDDRNYVDFATGATDSGDDIDVAIYLRSWRPGSEDEGSVSVNSRVVLQRDATVVVDAGERVTLGEEFRRSILDQTNRLEVVSRRSNTLDEVMNTHSDPFLLPYADNPEAIRDEFNADGGFFAGAYVLRGVRTSLAEILGLTNPVPLSTPRPMMAEASGEVEKPDTKALADLLSELGIGVQPYVTEAYAASLSTDLRLYHAAEKLKRLIPILKDADGTQVAALRVTAEKFFPTLSRALSEEQNDSFAQELARHEGDGTDFDLAARYIAALAEYVTILRNDVGLSAEKSVDFVMDEYVKGQTEHDISLLVIRIQLERTSRL